MNTLLGEIEVVDEPTHTIGSADNLRKYQLELNLDPDYRPSSVHGVLLNGAPLAVFANAGGASGVHAHSAICLAESIYLAVGDSVVCFTLQPITVKWALQVDVATCFGVYYHPLHDALISHGELSIMRFSRDGNVVWSAGGADILSDGFSLGSQYVEVVDFNHRHYQFSYANGKASA